MSGGGGPWFLADDLSGALEVGASWRSAGARVRIALEGERSRESAQAGREAIVGVSSETRNMRPDAARVGVAEALARWGAGSLLFKKIDSTLRGPIGAELAALRAAAPDRPLLFCPANPAAGRVVRDGLLFVNGVPVHETSFARDPEAPVLDSRVTGVLERPVALPFAAVALASVRAETGVLARALDRAWATAPVASCDAETMRDLGRLLAAAAMADGRFLSVGAGGLARGLVESAGFPQPRAPAASPEPLRGRVLFVVGSVHPASRRQLAHLQRLGVPVVALPEVDQAGVGPVPTTGAADKLAAHLADRSLAALTTTLSGESAPAGARAPMLAGALAVVVAETCRRFPPDALVVTGGDVARRIFAGLGGTGLEVLGEYRPGVAAARLEGAPAGPLSVVVKPGGFGADDLFERLMDSRSTREDTH